MSTTSKFKNSAAAPDIKEIPARTPSEKSGIQINANDVIAMGIVYEPNSVYEAKMTLVLKGQENALETILPIASISQFVSGIYKSRPEEFMISNYITEFLPVGNRAHYYMPTGQSIKGTLVQGDSKNPWALDLKFTGAGSMKIVLAGYHRFLDHGIEAARLYARDLDVISKHVSIIRTEGENIYTTPAPAIGRTYTSITQ